MLGGRERATPDDSPVSRTGVCLRGVVIGAGVGAAWVAGTGAGTVEGAGGGTGAGAGATEGAGTGARVDEVAGTGTGGLC